MDKIMFWLDTRVDFVMLRYKVCIIFGLATDFVPIIPLRRHLFDLPYRPSVAVDVNALIYSDIYQMEILFGYCAVASYKMSLTLYDIIRQGRVSSLTCILFYSIDFGFFE